MQILPLTKDGEVGGRENNSLLAVTYVMIDIEERTCVSPRRQSLQPRGCLSPSDTNAKWDYDLCRTQRLECYVYLKVRKASCLGGAGVSEQVTTDVPSLLYAFMGDFLLATFTLSEPKLPHLCRNFYSR